MRFSVSLIAVVAFLQYDHCTAAEPRAEFAQAVARDIATLQAQFAAFPAKNDFEEAKLRQCKKLVVDLLSQVQTEAEAQHLAAAFSNLLCANQGFVLHDYYVLWKGHSLLRQNVRYNRPLLKCLANKIAEKRPAQLSQEVHAELNSFAITFLEMAISFEQPDIVQNGEINWCQWRIFKEWIERNHEKLVFDEPTRKFRLAKSTALDVQVAWPAYLARHDLLWERLPQAWYQAPFLGNGMLGTMLRQTGPQTLQIDVNRCDVQEHRPRGKPGDSHFGQSRLPIGHFNLETIGKLTGCNWRLSLYNAELTGTLTTDRGTIGVTSYVHAEAMVIVVELAPSEGERACRVQWQPAEPLPPRVLHKKIKSPYEPHPPLQQRAAGETNLSVQRYNPAGEAATAWRTTTSDGKQTLLVTVAYAYPIGDAVAEALATIERFGRLPREQQIASHRRYWHRYYPQSFVSIPDPWWESFYWVQMYKLASATRSDRAIIDNTGPWLQVTPWAAVWWDLNVQLTYWPPLASNRLDLAESLANKLDANVENLRANVPEPYRKDSLGISVVAGQDLVSDLIGVPGKMEKKLSGLQYTGLLSWALHDYWLYCQFQGDDQRLRDKFFPLLKGATNYYLHFLQVGPDGKLHLPDTYSPEYASGPDCNFDLALLRWSCQTLVEICEQHKIDDPLLPRWRAVLAKLADYPVDATGYMIARGVPLATGHRHYSHLLMAYPLYLVNADQPGAKPLVMKSVKHWQGLGKQTGYSCTGAASLCAAFGEGAEALTYLNMSRRFMEATTMYRESGPVIETPLSAAQSIHDMLLQSWGGTIRVFPAVPPEWKDVVIHDMRAAGAFLVSAERRGGQTRWIRIKSLAGKPCRLRHDLAGDVRVSAAGNVETLPGGVLQLDLQQGEEAILFGNERPAELAIAPVTAPGAADNPFGLRGQN